jgi:hypothetical protein
MLSKYLIISKQNKIHKLHIMHWLFKTYLQSVKPVTDITSGRIRMKLTTDNQQVEYNNFNIDIEQKCL